MAEVTTRIENLLFTMMNFDRLLAELCRIALSDDPLGAQRFVAVMRYNQRTSYHMGRHMRRKAMEEGKVTTIRINAREA